jgi:hypothetical protein
MRYIAVGIATAFIVMMGLTLRPGPHATAAVEAPTLSSSGTTYPNVDVNKLPVAEHVDAY